MIENSDQIFQKILNSDQDGEKEYQKIIFGPSLG